MLVPKKDKSLRFGADYHRINAVTVRESYPIPHIGKCIDALGEAQIYSTLHANSEYWQILTDNKNAGWNASVTYHRLFKYSQTPFWIRNHEATFQRAMEGIPDLINWQHAIVHIDDTIILSKTPERSLRHKEKLLRQFRDTATKIKLKMCFIFGKAMNYLGHAIFSGKLQVGNRTTEAIEALQCPTTVSKLCSIPGFCNVNRWLIPISHSSPLH